MPGERMNEGRPTIAFPFAQRAGRREVYRRLVSSSLVALQLLWAGLALGDSVPSLAPVDAAAREIRAAIRSSLSGRPQETQILSDGEQTLATLMRRLRSTAERAIQLPHSEAAARVLIHLHHSARLLRSQQRIDLDSASLDTLPWLERGLDLLQQTEHPSALRAHIRLEKALLEEERGRPQNALENALRSAREAAFEAAESGHDDTLYRARWLIGRLHEAAGNDAASLSAYRDAVATLETMKAEIVARASEDALSFQLEVEPVYRQLAGLLLEHAAKASPATEQTLLLEARDTVERSREAELRDYYQDECLATPEKNRADSIPASVLIHPITLDDRVEIIVGRDGRLSRHRTSLSPADLERLARGFRRDLEKRMTRRYVRAAETLYDALIRPIEDRIQEAPVDTLVFFPGEHLRQIPFGALRDRESKRFLIEDHAIAVAPSLALTDPRPIRTAESSILASGLTQSVQGFAALPNVSREIDAARDVFPGMSLLDAQFRVAALEEAIRGVPYDVFHIASHARFSSNADESFILTWDDRLPLETLSELLGRTRFRSDHPIELLVLSACETAAGDNRSTLGLAGAALQMGARSVVGSLWSVDDEASSLLMTHFYRALAQPDTSRAEALRRAQLSLLEQDEYAHPIDWAAFLLISNWL